jgi:quercetin dioxygenase-like cupin family protein
MRQKRLCKRSPCVSAFAIILSSQVAWSQQIPPTENKGLKAPVITYLDLGPEIEGMEGRQLRMRKFTLEPGGVIAVHPHKDRPSAVYLLQGNLTELRPDGKVIEHQEGEAWAEGKATTHWAENRGTKPVIFISVDIFKQE